MRFTFVPSQGAYRCRLVEFSVLVDGVFGKRRRNPGALSLAVLFLAVEDAVEAAADNGGDEFDKVRTSPKDCDFLNQQ